MSELKPCQCDLNLLNDRILNLGSGLATMPENGTMQVNKAFLTAVLGYMEELLGMRRAQPTNEPLTLEELREMDGEPVFLIIEDVNGFGPITMWALVEIEEDGIWMTNNLGGRSYCENALDDGINVYARKTEMKGSKNE